MEKLDASHVDVLVGVVEQFEDGAEDFGVDYDGDVLLAQFQQGL
jgi:hypothetical protein